MCWFLKDPNQDTTWAAWIQQLLFPSSGMNMGTEDDGQEWQSIPISSGGKNELCLADRFQVRQIAISLCSFRAKCETNVTSGSGETRWPLCMSQDNSAAPFELEDNCENVSSIHLGINCWYYSRWPEWWTYSLLDQLHTQIVVLTLLSKGSQRATPAVLFSLTFNIIATWQGQAQSLAIASITAQQVQNW